MAINKFNDILERTKRHNEERKADRELKKKGIDKMNPDSWWADDGGEGKIDVPGFDATIQDLPEQDVNEKEIKVVPQGTSYMLPSEEGKNYSLEQLAGNGMPEEEIKEPEIKEPSGTSFELPSEENPEWDLEDYAGNGQREEVAPPQDDTVVEEPGEEESLVEEPEFSEDDVIPEPEEDENSVSDEEVENTPAPEQPPSEEQPPADKTVADQKLESQKKEDEGQEDDSKKEESVFDDDDEGEIEDEEEEKKPAPITKTEQGPVNDDTDLLKKGSGVSVSDMVDRSQIPHYDYLSFFR